MKKYVVLALAMMVSGSIFAQGRLSDEQVTKAVNENSRVAKWKSDLVELVNASYSSKDATCSQYNLISRDEVSLSEFVNAGDAEFFKAREIEEIVMLSSHCNVKNPTQDQQDWIDFIQVGISASNEVIILE